MNFGERVGSGSNNTMSLWTWPWNKRRPFLRRAPRKRQESTATKYNKCALVAASLLLVLAFWEETKIDMQAVMQGVHVVDVHTGEASENIRSRTKNLSLAVLVAGSTRRFLFDSFVEHVAGTSTSVDMDYFAILTLQSGPAFRQDDGYMGHLVGRDKIFHEILDPSNTNAEKLKDNMMMAMVSALSKTTSTNIRALRLLETPLEDDPILDNVREQQEKILKTSFETKDDLFRQFPMLDKRQKALKRTQAGNKNMIRLFLALESLWKKEFLEYETEKGTPYDYVLILRDDTLWLGDFDLQTVIASDPTADAYILSCDARDPKMLPPEINDHGILVKRSKASILGEYVSALATLDLQKCHESVTEFLGKERGCNSEMILKHVLETNQVKVKLVPQSLLPFERAVLIDGKSQSEGETDFFCYHKFCQSVDAPLQLPSDLQKCNELTFPSRR